VALGWSTRTKGRTRRVDSNGEGVNSDCRSTPCDLNYNIATPPTLLGAQNPELLGLVNKVFRIILSWDPLHGFGLAKIGEKKSAVEGGLVHG